MLLALGFAYSPCFFKKIGQPRQLFHLFLSFQRHIITIFTTNKCEKCPSSIWCRDSNSRPLEHESPPITTRPGLKLNIFSVRPMPVLPHGDSTSSGDLLVSCSDESNQVKQEIS